MTNSFGKIIACTPINEIFSFIAMKEEQRKCAGFTVGGGKCTFVGDRLYQAIIQARGGPRAEQRTDFSLRVTRNSMVRNDVQQNSERRALLTLADA